MLLFGLALGAGAIGFAWQRERREQRNEPARSLAATPAPRPETPVGPGADRVVGIGYVDVDGGATPLALPIPGPVERVFAVEGREVQAGDVLVQLRNQRAAATVTKAEAAVIEARTKLDQAGRAAAQHDLRRRQQQQAVAAAKAQRSSAERQVESLRGLAGSASVSEEKYLVAADNLEGLRAAVQVEELKLRQLELDEPAEAVT
ncbi:MAG TPA: biotin/lipoyl-binding protein, partial [Planctomycetia bacterium]|nr:biotin/lipoyl-binding protein [Planctomycetia bacterium]